MNLVLDKAKIDDHLRQVGSVDPTRNAAFSAGASFQLNLDTTEYTKVLNENTALKAEVAALKAHAGSKPAAKKPTAKKTAAPAAPAAPATKK